MIQQKQGLPPLWFPSLDTSHQLFQLPPSGLGCSGEVFLKTKQNGEITFQIDILSCCKNLDMNSLCFEYLAFPQYLLLVSPLLQFEEKKNISAIEKWLLSRGFDETKNYNKLLVSPLLHFKKSISTIQKVHFFNSKSQFLQFKKSISTIQKVPLWVESVRYLPRSKPQ